ncbi:MAG: hypothetical protein EBS31_07610 [Burkholderiaceae bacterium]|nr:hypothetical protein [Burkholderiaceae bacterium]
MSYTDYKHDETKGSEVESTFKNKGWEAHIGGTHIPVSTALGQLKGAWGIQASESRLRMTSDHPLLPNSNTNTKAFFVFEELAFAPKIKQSILVHVSKMSEFPPWLEMEVSLMKVVQKNSSHFLVRWATVKT